MTISKKKIEQSDNIRQLLADAYLGIKVDEMKIVNPLLNIPYQFQDNPEYWIAYLMMQPEYFSFVCSQILNFHLLPFQTVVLKQLWDHKFPMFIGSRGCGKSSLAAVYLLLRAMLIPNRKIVVAGSVFRQSKIVFEYMESIWRNAPLLRDICNCYGVGGPKKEVDMWRFFVADSQIMAIPIGASGDNVRGLRAQDLWTDEMKSVSKDIFETVLSGFLSVSASPSESVKQRASRELAEKLGFGLDFIEEETQIVPNQLILSGTAYYQFNHFYNYWKLWHSIITGRRDEEDATLTAMEGLNPKDFCIIRLPIDLVPKGFMDDAQVSRAKASHHSGAYQCEYQAVFSTDSAGFYKRSLLETCTVGKNNIIRFSSCGQVDFTPMLRGSSNRSYIYGIDPASEIDNFAITILELHPEHRRVVYVWTTNRRKQKEAIKANLIKEHDYYTYCTMKIRELMSIFPCKRIALDSQGGGYQILEALSRTDNLRHGEVPIYESIEPGKPKDTDGKEGFHIVELVQFADTQWIAEANHGMRKDFEDKVLLFPSFDNLTFAMAEASDQLSNRTYDTMEDLVIEIEELKNELASIIITQTATGKDKWDTPDTLEAGKKKGKMHKDRYSALLMANAVARMEKEVIDLGAKSVFGGFSYDVSKREKVSGPEYIGPSWFTTAMQNVYD